MLLQAVKLVLYQLSFCARAHTISAGREGNERNVGRGSQTTWGEIVELRRNAIFNPLSTDEAFFSELSAFRARVGIYSQIVRELLTVLMSIYQIAREVLRLSRKYELYDVSLTVLNLACQFLR